MIMELENYELHTLEEHLQNEEVLSDLFLEVMAFSSPYILY